MPAVRLRYGESGLLADLPASPGFAGVLSAREPPALPDPAAEVARLLEHPQGTPPLEQLARGRRDACIVVSDQTRPVPHHQLLPPIVEVLLRAGIPRAGIRILVAKGIHGPSTPEEHAALLSSELARRFQVIDHRASAEEELVEVGSLSQGVPLRINRIYAQADLKILTGLIEPHMWAGYSGGRKSILPGITGLDTVRVLHGPAMIAHARTTSGQLRGNPFHSAALEALELAGADFLVNLTVDRRHRATAIFAGHAVHAHQAGCDFLARHCVRHVERPLDFLLTTNGGAPLDCSLYQAVKGMTGATPALRPGGEILIACRCPEGLGSAAYQQVLGMVDEPRAFLERLHRGEFFLPDQWCAQETLQVALRHPVHIFSEGLQGAQVAALGLQAVSSVEQGLQALLARHGRAARWAVVPDGPGVVLRCGGP